MGGIIDLIKNEYKTKEKIYKCDITSPTFIAFATLKYQYKIEGLQLPKFL